jgi:long-chain acyl-CoA synthetase
MAGTLIGAVAEGASQKPNAAAILEKRFGKWNERSRSELVSEAGRVAAGLTSAGVGPGDTVAVIMSARFEWIAIDLGIQATGARTLAIGTTTTKEDMAGLLTQSGAATVIVEGQDQADVVLSLVDEGRAPAIRSIVYLDPAGVSEYTSELLSGLDSFEGSSDLGSLASSLDPTSAAVRVPTPDLDGLIDLDHATLVQATRTTIDAFDLGTADRVVALRDIADPAERGTTIYAAIIAGALLALPENRATRDAAIHEIAPTYLHATERWLTQKAAGITVRFDENRGLKSRLAASWRKRTGSTLDRYGSGKPAGGLWRFTVTLPVLEELGLEKARAVVVCGDPSPRELLGFYTALGLPVKAALTLPKLGGFATIGDPGTADGWVGTAAPGAAVTVEGGTLVVTTPATGRLDTGVAAEASASGFIVNGSTPEVAAETRLRSIPVFSTALVSPGAREVIIELDGPIASRWAVKNHLDAATYRSFARLPEMLEGVEAAVAGVLGRFELTPGSIRVLTAPLHEVPGALTFGDVPRRRVVEQH